MGWLEIEQKRAWSGEVAVDLLWRSVEIRPVAGVPPAVDRSHGVFPATSRVS